MKHIEPQTAEEWELYYDMRFRILREPWGQMRGSERDDTDRTSTNLLLLDTAGNPCAVARLHLNSATQAQVRYMAVDTGYQSKGVGSHLLHVLEDYAVRQGAHEVILEARETAVQFYERNGYSLVGKSYLLFDEIQHYTMLKQVGTPLHSP